MRSFCCARAAIGDTTAAPPRSVMNSRRFISLPELATDVSLAQFGAEIARLAFNWDVPDVRSGSKTEVSGLARQVGFTLISRHGAMAAPASALDPLSNATTVDAWH
jgi:hypothetical protein